MVRGACGQSESVQKSNGIQLHETAIMSLGKINLMDLISDKSLSSVVAMTSSVWPQS